MTTTLEPGGRILLVDDDVWLLEATAGILAAAGHDVVAAATAARAVELVHTQDFDACFVDIGLGRESGLAIILEFGRVAPLMRVVMLSGHNDPAIEKQARNMGALEFIRKPCRSDLLRRTAVLHVAAARRARRANGPPTG